MITINAAAGVSESEQVVKKVRVTVEADVDVHLRWPKGEAFDEDDVADWLLNDAYAAPLLAEVKRVGLSVSNVDDA